MEINYELLSYGIRMHILPCGVTSGDGSIASHKNWIEMQRRKEENSSRGRTYIPVHDERMVPESSFSCAHTLDVPNNIDDKPFNNRLTDAGTSQALVHSCATPNVPSTSNDAVGQIVVEKVKSVELKEDLELAETLSQPSSNSVGPQEVIKSDEAPDSPGTVVPQPNDVLFGRGRNVQDHPGNLRLHQLIENNRTRYEDAPKWEKTVIASEIVAIIKEENGRFLKAVSGSGNKKFIVQDSEAARDKVSHTFRSRRTADNNLQAAAAASSGALRHPRAGSASHNNFSQLNFPSGVIHPIQNQGMITPGGLVAQNLWNCTAGSSSQFNGGGINLQDLMTNPTKRPKL